MMIRSARPAVRLAPATLRGGLHPPTSHEKIAPTRTRCLSAASTTALSAMQCWKRGLNGAVPAASFSCILFPMRAHRRAERLPALARQEHKKARRQRAPIARVASTPRISFARPVAMPVVTPHPIHPRHRRRQVGQPLRRPIGKARPRRFNVSCPQLGSASCGTGQVRSGASEHSSCFFSAYGLSAA